MALTRPNTIGSTRKGRVYFFSRYAALRQRKLERMPRPSAVFYGKARQRTNELHAPWCIGLNEQNAAPYAEATPASLRPKLQTPNAQNIAPTTRPTDALLACTRTRDRPPTPAQDADIKRVSGLRPGENKPVSARRHGRAFCDIRARQNMKNIFCRVKIAKIYCVSRVPRSSIFLRSKNPDISADFGAHYEKYIFHSQNCPKIRPKYIAAKRQFPRLRATVATYASTMWQKRQKGIRGADTGQSLSDCPRGRHSRQHCLSAYAPSHPGGLLRQSLGPLLRR